MTASPTGRFSRHQQTRSPSPPPFGLDYDPWSPSSRASTASSTARSTASRGFRDGGPKEARLKRVAFLSMVKEVDHLYPVKIEKLSKSISAEKIAEEMSQYGEVGDVYVPISHSTLQPTGGFAVVRFTNRDAVDRLLDEELHSKEGHRIAGEPVTVAPVSPQRSFFTRGTGYHGICNVPVDDGTYVRGMPIPEQEIPLSSCMSRCGYPWGSVRELKFLAPHPPTDKLDGFALKVTNIPHHISEEELHQYFSKFGSVLSVSCPKPILVVEKVSTPNCGVCWVKFEDKRDMAKAHHAILQGLVSFDGQIAEAISSKPRYWPTEETRRYY